ncbi:hypothetical protein ABWI01_03505 [Oceanicaulis alexandrii]|uniref:hypothetical protein n=1 Tax=Oceanicaulis alexandrii TaxID=153233 RepID=UPI0035D0155C
MSADRITTDGERRALRRAARTGLSRHGASQKEFSDLSGYDAGTLSRCLSGHQAGAADHCLPIDRAVEFDRFLGEPVHLRAMATLLHCTVIPLPEIDPSAQGSQALAALFKELGEAVGKAGETLEDNGRLDAGDDLVGLIDSLDEAMEAAASVRAIAQALLDGGEGK